jgi:predicted nucleic acid-binding protein
MQDRERVFLDTNILVYIANEDSPFHPKVLKKFKEIAISSEFWISRQVLREYAVVMTRQGIVEKPLSSESVVMDIKQWSSCFNVADETQEVTDLLLELIEKHQVKGKRIHDINIVATMKLHSIHKLFTMNIDDFNQIDDLEMIPI